MKKIEKIVFKNFKAFYGEQAIDLKSKNMLLYGENGSGKSSIFWGLYTFLQSTTKSQDEIKKYFVQFNETDSSTFESLKNVFATAGEDAFVELVTKDLTTGTFYTDKIAFDNSSTSKEKNNHPIQLANASSDFINYKLLHNFYNITHKQEINLWQVFMHDIFPFFRHTETEDSYGERISTLTKDIPRTRFGQGRATSTRSRVVTTFNTNISTLNNDIDIFLAGIESYANNFLKENFYDNKEKIRLFLKYDRKIDYATIKDKKLANYQIKLLLEQKNELTGDWIKIPRPHSFLNEAQLTRIAIAVRIGALMTRVLESDYKILCLDDMLISLDMGNREKVIKTFLNTEKSETLKDFDDYQKLIFTHDRAFYNLCKQRIELDLDKTDWVFKEMYIDNDKTPVRPFIDNSTDYFERAEKHLKAFDYPASANALRQGLENMLFNFLSDNEKRTLDVSNNSTTGKQFNDLLQKVKQIHEKNRVPLTTINDLFIYKDHILNPFSHDNIDSAIFKEEIEKILTIIPILKNLKSELLKNVGTNPVIKYIDTDATTGEEITYKIFLSENLRRYTLIDNSKVLSRAKVIALKKIDSKGVETPLTNPYENLKQCINRLSGFLGRTYSDDDQMLSKLNFL